MKNFNKILIASFLMSFGVASAQTGIGTINPDVSAVLDVSSSSKGILFPRLSTFQRDAINSAANGLVIYNTTTNEIQVNVGTSLLPTWVVSGITLASNGLTVSSNDVKLGGTLSAATIIDQNNNNLTLTSGTARTIINGTLQTTGAVYAKVRTVTSLPIVWADDDYMIIVKVAAAQNLILPDPSLYSGRVICIRNGSVSAGTSGTYTYITNVPQDVTSITANRGQMFVSDGTKWFLITGV